MTHGVYMARDGPCVTSTSKPRASKTRIKSNRDIVFILALCSMVFSLRSIRHSPVSYVITQQLNLASSSAKVNMTRRNIQPPRSKPTHFLCVPLINSASLLQLESSLAAFKDEYPPVSSESATSGTIQSADGQSKASPIPEGAHRPLGTLHLTLGVMYLPSPERLRAAIGLFQSLDLAAIMREAESLAIPPDDAARPWHTEHSEHKAKPLTSPLSVSLESLHPLPTARKATVLYVEPFDPTGRLWAFCVLLRRHFIKAGFIEGGQHPPGKGADLTSQRPGEVADEGARPLLLHATIVNTSYVRRKPARSKSQNSPKEPKRLEMDVRSLLKHYQSYYADEARTVRQEADASSDTSLQASGESPAEQLRPKYPFVWAKDVPIQSVCICQMGAKDISADNPVPGDLLDGDQFKFENLPARLGQQYAVISKQDLNFWEA